MRVWFFILLFGFSSGWSQSGFNLPHLKHFSRTEIDLLAGVLPDSLNYRLYGGEASSGYAYPADMGFIQDIIYFLTEVRGTATIVFPPDYRARGTVLVLKALEASQITVKWIEYGNEEYYAPPIRNFRDWLDLIFNPRGFYRKLAHRHMAASLDMLRFLADNDIDGWDRFVFNIPLLNNDNRNYKAYTEVVANYDHVTTVDVHIYGKVREPDFEDKLYGNLEYIAGFNWEIGCWEMNGLWHYGSRRLDLVLINGILHRDSHEMIMEVAADFGLVEVIYFTLASNERIMNWSNPPYFQAYHVGEEVEYLINNVWQ